jgi:transketolase
MTLSTTLGYDDLPDLMTLMTGDEKHGASATSTLDVLWVLYDRVLHTDPEDPARDRFLLSKGHGPMAYYAVLAAKGFLSPADLRDFGGPDSILGYHPDHTRVPGVEIGSGSLGHGLGVAALLELRVAQQHDGAAPRSGCGCAASTPAPSCCWATRSSRRAATPRPSSTPAAPASTG